MEISCNQIPPLSQINPNNPPIKKAGIIILKFPFAAKVENDPINVPGIKFNISFLAIIHIIKVKKPVYISVEPVKGIFVFNLITIKAQIIPEKFKDKAFITPFKFFSPQAKYVVQVTNPSQDAIPIFSANSAHIPQNNPVDILNAISSLKTSTNPLLFFKASIC